MNIPIILLQQFIENLDSNLKNVDNPKIRELRRRIPLELTTLEKNFDKTYIDKLLIHEKHSAVIRIIIDMILQKQNLEFLEQKEKDRDRKDLEDYLNAKEAQDKSLRDEYQRLLQIAQADEQQRANMQELIALQNLIALLENQNGILRTIRTEIIQEAASTLGEELRAIEPFSKISKEEHARILSPLIDKALAIHEEYDLKIKAFESNPKTYSDIVTSTKDNSRVKYTPMVDGVGSIENERENTIKSLFYDVYLEKFSRENISFSHPHLTDSSNMFFLNTVNIRLKTKPIDELIKKNVLHQSAATRRHDELQPLVNKYYSRVANK